MPYAEEPGIAVDKRQLSSGDGRRYIFGFFQREKGIALLGRFVKWVVHAVNQRANLACKQNKYEEQDTQGCNVSCRHLTISEPCKTPSTENQVSNNPGSIETVLCAQALIRTSAILNKPTDDYHHPVRLRRMITQPNASLLPKPAAREHHFDGAIPMPVGLRLDC